MGLSFKKLITPMTAAEILESLESVMESLEFPVASWAVGRIGRALLSLFARTLAPWTEFLAKIAASGLLDSASGVGLEVLAEQVFQQKKEQATFATGELTLTNSKGGSYTLAARALLVSNPTTKKLYRNSSAFTIGPNATVTITIEAVEVGADSTSAPGSITSMVTTLNGVACSNAVAVVGRDAERDESLRARCRLYLASLSPNGPAAAYDYVARTRALNGDVDVNRTRVAKDSGVGNVIVYVAGPSGEISDTTSIQTAVRKLCTPICIDSSVVSATEQTQAIGINVYLNAGDSIASADAQAIVESAVSSWIPTLPIGGQDLSGTGVPGKLFRTALAIEVGRALKAEFGIESVTVDVATPSSDLTYTSTHHVLVASSISVGVAQVEDVTP